MRKINIPIFVSHQGCPNDCIFCNQKKITGVYKKEKYEEYGKLFGPLNLNQAKGRTQEFQWTLAPWPWEGGCE